MKQIDLPHKVCGLTCMVNGLEDLYEQKTGVRLPDWLFLHLSGLLGFVYLKNRHAPAPRMVFWGMQIARYQYEELADVVGFRWEMTAGRAFASSLKCLRACLDQGTPALLGPLDMYHLPYYDRFYHKVHVPIHHVLVVGYDDEQEAVLALDCDRADVQSIPRADLEAAWNVQVPGLGKKNTFYTFRFHEQVAEVETIARRGLKKRAEAMLAAPVSMLGLKGMWKLSAELPHWRRELDSRGLDASLRHLAEFTGFPPVPPNRLTGFEAPDRHTGGRDVFAGLLRRLSEEYHEPAWEEAAPLFDESAHELERLTDDVVDVILNGSPSLETAAERLSTIAGLEERAFRILQAA